MSTRRLVSPTILVAILHLFLQLPVGSPALGSDSSSFLQPLLSIPNDQIVLNEPLLKAQAAELGSRPWPSPLNPKVSEALKAYLGILTPVLKFLTQSYSPSDLVVELDRLANRPQSLKFYPVQSAEAMYQFCAPGGKKVYHSTPQVRFEQVACTVDEKTFLVLPLVQKMTIRELSMLLIHERYTTLRDAANAPNYKAIAEFTAGAKLYIDLYEEQAADNFRALSPREQGLLTGFYHAIQELYFRKGEISSDAFKWKAAAWGGGMVHEDARVDPTAVVGIQAAAGAHSVLEAGVRLERAAFGIMHLSYGRIEENSVIDRSSIQNLDLGRNSTIRNSFLRANTLKVGSHALIENSTINFAYHVSIGSHFTCRKSLISNKTDNDEIWPTSDNLVIASDQTLEDGEMSKRSLSAYYPASARYRSIDLVLSGQDIEMDVPQRIPGLDRLSVSTFFAKSPWVELEAQAKPEYTQWPILGTKFSANNVRFRLQVLNAPFVSTNGSAGSRHLYMVLENGQITRIGLERYLVWDYESLVRQSDDPRSNAEYRLLFQQTAQIVKLLAAHGFRVVQGDPRGTIVIEIPAQ